MTIPELSKTPDSWDQLLREDYNFAFMKGSYQQYMFMASESSGCCYGGWMRTQILMTWDQSFVTVLFKH